MPIKILDLTYAAAGRKTQSYKMGFDTGHHTQQFMYDCLTKGQFFDPPMVQVLTQFLQPGDTFMDIGSHVGYYSMLALQIVGSAGHVFAFEPNPETFTVLTLNSLLNNAGNLHAFNCAIADHAGVAALHINTVDEGLSSICLPGGEEQAALEQKKVTITTMTLDQLAEYYKFAKVKMVKIDVEGYELNVVKGGARFFDECSPPFIVFEVNSMQDDRSNDEYAIRKYFHGRGYKSYLIHPWPTSMSVKEQFDNKVILPLDIGVELDIGYGNILLSKYPLE